MQDGNQSMKQGELRCQLRTKHKSELSVFLTLKLQLSSGVLLARGTSWSWKQRE